MKLADFLIQSPDGEITLVGHRIGLYHLVRRYNQSESAEMLAARYPTLPLSLVHKAVAFYLENQSEVDAYIAACSAGQRRATARRQVVGPFYPSPSPGQRTIAGARSAGPLTNAARICAG